MPCFSSPSQGITLITPIAAALLTKINQFSTKLSLISKNVTPKPSKTVPPKSISSNLQRRHKCKLIQLMFWLNNKLIKLAKCGLRWQTLSIYKQLMVIKNIKILDNSKSKMKTIQRRKSKKIRFEKKIISKLFHNQNRIN